MIVTAKWIHKHKTKNGAWTRAQLAAVGVAWPPPKGWIGRVIGNDITEAQRVAFVQESAIVQSQLGFDHDKKT